MPRVSASSTPRWPASCSSSSSCARSLSPLASARVSRERQLRRGRLAGFSTAAAAGASAAAPPLAPPAAALSLALAMRSPAPIGIGDAHASQDSDFAPLHAQRVLGPLMIVADQVQQAVHEQVRPVILKALVLRARFAPQDLR